MFSLPTSLVIRSNLGNVCDPRESDLEIYDFEVCFNTEMTVSEILTINTGEAMRKSKVAMYVNFVFACAVVQAQTGSPSEDDVIRVSGFGTVGYVATNTDDGSYVAGSQKYGATRSGELGVESKVGFQLDAKYDSSISATTQVVSRQNYDGTFDPMIEWAFGKFNASPNLSLRIGRIGGPFFMTSDFRSVGYTSVLLRLPNDVYGGVPFRSVDGLDLIYRKTMSQAVVNTQLYLGESSAMIARNFNLKMKDIVGLSSTLEFDSFSIRVGHMYGNLDASGEEADGVLKISNGFNQLSGVSGLDSLKKIANELSINGKRAQFSGVGFTFDNNHLVSSGEITTRKSETLFVPDIDAWYVSVGYRLGAITPYVALSGQTTVSKTTIDSPSTVGYPSNIQSAVGDLIAAANSGVLINSTQKTMALGARWDLGRNYAIKGEYSRIAVPAGSSGGFSKVSGNKFKSDTQVDVISIGLDLIF